MKQLIRGGCCLIYWLSPDQFASRERGWLRVKEFKPLPLKFGCTDKNMVL